MLECWFGMIKLTVVHKLERSLAALCLIQEGFIYLCYTGEQYLTLLLLWNMLWNHF